jgi:hypothetical protein
MTKSSAQLKVMLILSLTIGVSHTMGGGMPYGGMPYGGSPYGGMPQGGMPGAPYGGYHGNPYKKQKNPYKAQIKQQQMQLFFSQNPRASKDQWQYYWKNYKRMHGID